MEEKIAYSKPFSSTREMVKFINEEKLTREDIITVLYMSGSIFLIYFK